MFDIFLAILLFFTAVGLHILFCRHTTQTGLHAKPFIILAIGALIVYALLTYITGRASLFDPRSLWGMSFAITGGIIFVSLVPIYLSFYILTQLTSPSQKILLLIASRGELSYADIVAYMEAEDFIRTRLNDLCVSRCVVEKNGLYALSVEGHGIAMVLNLMRSLLGRNVGG